MRQLSLSHWEGEPAPPRGHALGNTGFFLGGWNHRSQKFTVSQLQSESMAWVRNAQAYLAQEEDHKRKLLKAIGPRTKGSLAVARAVGMLRERHKSEMAQLLGATIMMPQEHCEWALLRVGVVLWGIWGGWGEGWRGGCGLNSWRVLVYEVLVNRSFGTVQCAHNPPSKRPLSKPIPRSRRPVYNPKWRASHPLEDCPTATWVGHGRWALLDLTAQKTEYGPAVGGEGGVGSG